MTTQRDYYEILEVGKDASEEDIRKAFRQKALEFHPDRNKDADAGAKFKEVNEAYQVLTDPERRQRYDRFGHAGANGGAQSGGFDGGDIFGGFGDIFDAFFGGGPRTQTRAQPGRDLQTTITIAFEEAVFGVTHEIEIERREKCTRCEGSRSEPGHSASTCSNCKGSGRVRRAQRSVFGQFVTEAACNVCDGTGQQVSDPCTKCKGSGRERAKSKIKVQVPAGVPAGANLNLRGQGDFGERGANAGDLYVGIRVKPHAEFERDENDILYELELTYPQAALGLELEVPTLEGPHKMNIPAGTQNDETFRIKGQGVPHLGRVARRGDQLVTVRIATPEKLNKRQKELLEELQRSFTDRK